MKLFLKIKHWQLFLLLFVPSFFIDSRLSMIIIIMCILILFSFWIYSIGVLGRTKIREIELKQLPLTLFAISCILMPILWLLSIVDPFLVLGIELGENVIRIIKLIISLGFLLSGIYMIVCVSMTIEEIELKDKPKIKDYILTIIWFFILPIGIWFIQPRINKIYTLKK